MTHSLSFVVMMTSLLACSPHAAVLPVQTKPCPIPRDLARRFDAAEVVVRGRVTYDRDCLPSGWRGGRPFLDCHGRRADIVVTQVWKGRLRVGDGLALIVPTPQDSAGLLLRKGETAIVFAQVYPESIKGPTYYGVADGCMFPEGYRSQADLAIALDSLTATTGRP